MAVTDTNLFPIRGLEALSPRYRLYRIRGLDRAPESVFTNRSQLSSLSRKLKCPVSVVDRDQAPYLLLPEDKPPPSDVPLVGTIVTFESGPAVDIDFQKPDSWMLDAIVNVLRFHIDTPLWNRKQLWRPGAGRPYFYRTPSETKDGVARFEGFRVRPLFVDEIGFSLCVDATSMFVRSRPLPAQLTRDEFARRLSKHKNYIYHYGDSWYEVRLHTLAEQTADEYLIPRPDGDTRLLDYIIANVPKPISPELTSVPAACSVALYRNGQGSFLGAPTALCYPVVPTTESGGAGVHRRSILPPHVRRAAILNIVRRELATLEVAGSRLRVETGSARLPAQQCVVPDLEFGRGEVLSVRGSAGATGISLADLGRGRLDALQDPAIGFFDRRPLDRHYVVLPKSVAEAAGDIFLRDLVREVRALLPADSHYEPTLVTYADSGPRTLSRQAAAVLEALVLECSPSSYATVMLHRIGEADEALGAMILQRADAKLDLRVSVIHSDMVRTSYESHVDRLGNRYYAVRANVRRQLAGYLRNVALNKVLLANGRTPFVLATPLHADLTIGLDVKENTAALVAVNSTATVIVDDFERSRQKEQLLEKQTAVLIERAVEKMGLDGATLRSVVLQRDGRLWPSELSGAQLALDRLRANGLVSSHVTLTAIEVLKTSPAAVRLFDVRRHGPDCDSTLDPQVGTFIETGPNDAYLANTGRPFRRPGTAHPLHIRRVTGPLPLKKCTEDVYSLSCLTWSRPEDCSRVPVTLRLLDQLLRGVAGTYDDLQRYATELEPGGDT